MGESLFVKFQDSKKLKRDETISLMWVSSTNTIYGAHISSYQTTGFQQQILDI